MALLGKNRHYDGTAQQLGYGDDAEDVIQELIECTPSFVESVQKFRQADLIREVESPLF